MDLKKVFKALVSAARQCNFELSSKDGELEYEVSGDGFSVAGDSNVAKVKFGGISIELEYKDIQSFIEKHS